MRLLIVLAALPLAACGSVAMGNEGGAKAPASGSGDARSFQIAGFDAVDLRGSDDVDVKVGPAFSVRAEGPSAELDKLDIRKDGSTLKVGRVRRDGFSWGADHGKAVRVYVTLPALKGASVAGSGDMTVDRVTGGNLDASIAGSGDLTIGEVGVASAALSIAGSGDIALKGRADRIKVSIAGSGGVDGEGLKAAGADVSIAGSGDVRADVTGNATVSLMGSGDVDLGAGAHCTTTKMGSGEVRCGR
ncbi:head GIN domain-containing protein [Sphingomonas sp.]|uniref:head GIN domain-containing protein n=1 Tax=Sphingomonas sp. TaxID=28214 RepID=UPI002CE67E4C|nr:head GIN domain-containing protein [Sphingomonas sp.]HWK36202.1 head GIN domain-containing protein [Sphingomonas sp.]